jgi:hypothetical protein
MFGPDDTAPPSFVSWKIEKSEDTDELGDSIKKSQRHWGTNPEATLYWGTSNIESEITPGLYKCVVRDHVFKSC